MVGFKKANSKPLESAIRASRWLLGAELGAHAKALSNHSSIAPANAARAPADLRSAPPAPQGDSPVQPKAVEDFFSEAFIKIFEL